MVPIEDNTEVSTGVPSTEAEVNTEAEAVSTEEEAVSIEAVVEIDITTMTDIKETVIK